MNLATRIAGEVRRLDPEVVASQIRPLDRYLSDAVAPRRFSLSLMAAFALAALGLAVTGVYAVVVYSVSQRAHEISIRVALGASRSSIVRLVIAQGARFVAIGIVVGVAMALGAARLVSALLFGVTPTDAAAFGQVAAVVGAVSLLACALPAGRLRSVRVGVQQAE
jgi:putative ABC transport system permease protein